MLSWVTKRYTIQEVTTYILPLLKINITGFPVYDSIAHLCQEKETKEETNELIW